MLRHPIKSRALPCLASTGFLGWIVLEMSSKRDRDYPERSKGTFMTLG